ncbi:TetR family transcriptional regulator, partial [Rhodococcus erythropolis]|nr:TetR family transcriptional regulator [Rhodococcus erythropolis]
MAAVSGSGGGDPVPERVTRIRMTGTQRRQQLIEIGRALFAERGYEATSIEEI